jgi:hypothetical protein
MEYRRCSLRLDAGEFDHLGPLFRFLNNEFSKVGRRHRHRHAAKVGEPWLNLGIREARIELSVELVDDLGRRGLRCPDAVPGARLGVPVPPDAMLTLRGLALP